MLAHRPYTLYSKTVHKIIAIILILLVTTGVIFSVNKKTVNEQVGPENNISESQPVASPSELPMAVDFTASFEIYTNGTKRIFTQAKYHNQSADVYITSTNPSTIYIKQRGITWDDFFKTLPFSVTKDCLVTGTQQTFCTTSAQKLKFYLNDVENPNALDLEIKEDDSLRIVY